MVGVVFIWAACKKRLCVDVLAEMVGDLLEFAQIGGGNGLWAKV
jgi:hypothetical protein